MKPLRFSWDDRKNKTNKKKHGISFAEAQTIFFDEDAILQSTGEILLVASPNNPTGFEISEEFLFKALRKFQFVILDAPRSNSLFL